MKRSHHPGQDYTDDALCLLKQIGAAITHPMVVITRDGTILYANPSFIGFIEGMGRWFLIRHVDEVSDFLPDRAVLDRVWYDGNPCSVEVAVPLAAGTTTMHCDCFLFMDPLKRVTLAILIYREIVPPANEASDTTGASSIPE